MFLMSAGVRKVVLEITQRNTSLDLGLLCSFSCESKAQTKCLEDCKMRQRPLRTVESFLPVREH